MFRYYDFSSDTWLSSASYESRVANVSNAKIDSDGQNNIYISWLQLVNDAMMSQNIRKYSLGLGWTDSEPIGHGYHSSMSSNFSGEVMVVNMKTAVLPNIAAFSTYYMP